MSATRRPSAKVWLERAEALRVTSPAKADKALAFAGRIRSARANRRVRKAARAEANKSGWFAL